MKVLAAVCTMLIVAASGYSQTDQIEQVIQNNRSLPQYRPAAENQFKDFENGLSTHCADVTVNWSAAHDIVVARGQLLSDGNLDGTVWEELVPGRACGQQRAYKAMVAIRGGKLSMYPMLPGDGWAGPLLQHDTMLEMNAAAAAYTRKSCPVDVINTHLVEGHPQSDPKAVWTEEWTVDSCGKRFTVPVTFVPDKVGDGTSMSVSPSAIKPLP